MKAPNLDALAAALAALTLAVCGVVFAITGRQILADGLIAALSGFVPIALARWRYGVAVPRGTGDPAPMAVDDEPTTPLEVGPSGPGSRPPRGY